MKIDELLLLPRKTDSIKDIDLFINNSIINSIPYFKAIVLKVDIIAINDINKALKIIYSYVNLFNEIEDESVVVIIDEILKLTLYCKRYDEYEKYLQIKQNRLDFKNEYLIFKDLFLLNLELNKFKEAKEYLDKYLLYNISSKEKVDLLYKYLCLCFDNTMTSEFNNALDLLKSSIFEVLNPSLELDINVKEVLFKAKTNDPSSYDLAVKLIQNNGLRNYQYLLLAVIIINYYIDINNLKAASLVEAEYSHYLESSCDYKYKKVFIDTCLKLYTKLNHTVSITYYNKLLDELNINNNDNKETYIIPETLVVSDNESTKNVIKVKKVLRNNLNVDVDKYLNIYNEILLAGSNTNDKLREYIRQMLIILAKHINSKYLNVIKVNSSNYDIYTFKNNKLYDNKYEDITDLIEYKIVHNNSDYFEISSDENDTKLYTKGISYNYIYKLLINNDTYLLVYLENKELDYNLCEFVAKIINFRINYNESHSNYEYNIELLKYIFNVSKSAIKRISNNTITSSALLDNIYNRDITTLDSFYSYLEPKDVNLYRTLLNELSNHPVNGRSIVYKYSYDFHDYYIKETFFPYLKDNEFVLYSYVCDVTEEYNKELKIDKLLYYNLESNLYNKNKFILDIEANLNNKYTIILFSLKNYHLYNEIYYTSFHNDYLKSISEHLINYKNTHTYMSFYQISDDKFASIISLDIDKRSVTKIIREFINSLDMLSVTVKYNIDAYYSTGAFRIKDYVTTDYKETYHYLNNAYLMAKNNQDNENTLIFYNHQTYSDFYENTILEHNINTYINQNKININYRQIINISELTVEGYIANLGLNNEIFNEEKIDKILELRDLKLRIEKYKLLKVFNDLKIVYQKVKGLFEVYIHIDKCLIDDNIMELVVANLRFFKLSGSFIKFIVDNYDPKLDHLAKYNIDVYSMNIYDIINNKTSNFALDASNIKLEELDNTLEFLSRYGAKVLLLNSPSLKEATKTKIKYITSNEYNKLFNINEIIDNIIE